MVFIFQPTDPIFHLCEPKFSFMNRQVIYKICLSHQDYKVKELSTSRHHNRWLLAHYSQSIKQTQTCRRLSEVSTSLSWGERGGGMILLVVNGQLRTSLRCEFFCVMLCPPFSE
jgi:hypothetical protein